MHSGPDGPAWLSDWLADAISGDAALARFDTLRGLAPEEMIGGWRGTGLPTGHPLDGLLEALGWHGKSVADPDHVHPLLFRNCDAKPVALDPAWMPVAVALRWPRFARSRLVGAAFRAGRPLLRTSRPAARIRTAEFRGRHSVALIYDRQPIVDHFRRIDGDRVLGLMERRGMPPFFFLLVAERT